MSFQPVIPGGLLSSRARFRFTGRSHSPTAAQCWYTLFQPTEGVPFLVCLTLGGKCSFHLRARKGDRRSFHLRILSAFRDYILWHVKHDWSTLESPFTSLPAATTSRRYSSTTTTAPNTCTY